MLVPDSPGIYYARNRTYHPTLGRFLQRDPNSTALPLLDAMSVNGQLMEVGFTSSFDIFALYTDGPNLYGILGSNPVNRHDPTGLFSLLETAQTVGIQSLAQGFIAGTCNGIIS